MIHTKYQGSRSYGIRQEDFFHFFPIKAYVKHVTHVAGPFLAPGACFEQTVEVQKVILHIKYQGFMSFGFRNEDFFHSSLYKLM